VTIQKPCQSTIREGFDLFYVLVDEPASSRTISYSHPCTLASCVEENHRRAANIFLLAVQNATPKDYAVPHTHVIQELLRQLDRWRTLLPKALQWGDNDRFVFCKPTAAATAGSPDPMFSFDETPTTPHELGGSVAIASAQLRSRYYYTRFMILRPFVFKALHFPTQMSDEDADYTGQCLQACLLWPIAMHPPKVRKRLIPYLFAWTQNFFGVLLILRMVSENNAIRKIAQTYLDYDEVLKTIHLLLDWFQDMRQIDGIAEWEWDILSHLYSDVIHNRHH
jgi:hypothetical protein